MAFDNKQLELDQYGRIVGSEITEHIIASIGLIECALCARWFENRIVIEANMWQGVLDRKLGITNFCASVFMRREGNRYRIINKGYRDYNDLWRELEAVISDCIMVNS